jgi:hypothetical protein
LNFKIKAKNVVNNIPVFLMSNASWLDIRNKRNIEVSREFGDTSGQDLVRQNDGISKTK